MLQRTFMFKAKPLFLILATLILMTLHSTIVSPEIISAGERRETDLSGKLWSLEDWQDGTRPYPKDLIQREAGYKQKWGESWAGARYNNNGGDGKYIMSPGTWQWEEFSIIPDGKSEWFGQSQALVYAPNGSEQVTAVYALTKRGIYHIDPMTKELAFAGSHTTGGFIDGIGEQARMEPTTNNFGDWATVDPVTGRVYFAQKLADGNLVMRYVEKLLPYEDSGSIYYLPAFLDYQNLYQQFKGPKGGNLTPVMQDGKRGALRLAVRTTPVKFPPGGLPGLKLWGNRVLLSPDGKSAYLETKPTWPRTINDIHAFDLQMGQDLGSIKKPASVPEGASGDQHDAISSLYDGYTYIVRHTGSGGGPGKLFRFNTATGNLEMLYDSSAIWPQSSPTDAKNPAGYYELKQQLDSTNRGPADATTLWFATTVFLFQSPRTGAIMNGGWDNTGIPMYHDGFLTSIAQTPQNPSPGGRPEWQGQYVANFGSLQTVPDVAPNGDIYLTDRGDQLMFTDSLRQNGIRIIRLHRTDWPMEQPVNGYANQFLLPGTRLVLMKEYAQNYILTIDESNIISDITAPTIPQNLTATAQSEFQIDLTWQPAFDPESGVSKYNIFRNGSKIAESTIPSYSDNKLAEATTYTYQVSAVNRAALESQMSTSISATTLADTTLPTILSANASGDSTKVTVTFSEPVEQMTATTVANYSINNGIAISSASLASDLTTVTLTTSTHQQDITYTLTVNNIRDRAKTPNTITPNTQRVYSFVAALVISNLTVNSGKAYQIVENGLRTGVDIYIDRSQTFTSIPTSLTGTTYIKTANDDKASTGTAFLSFQVNQAVTVYAAHDNRINPKPSWLASFTDTGNDLTTSDTTYSIFKKEFSAGAVTLGGNEGGGNSMYSVIIVGKGGSPPTDTTPPADPTGLRIQ